MEYLDALDRGLDSCPDIDREGGRLSVPDPVGETDGAFTRLTNLPAIADALSRDPEHLFRHVQGALATSAQFDGQQARFNGTFSVADFDDAISAYVSEFVTCSECGLPDTRLLTEDGTQRLRCDACGAFRPVEKNADTGGKTGNRATVEEGRTYQLRITGTGRKGDGVAEKGKYTIFVSGAREGDTVTAFIESVSGTLAFGRVA